MRWSGAPEEPEETPRKRKTLVPGVRLFVIHGVPKMCPDVIPEIEKGHRCKAKKIGQNNNLGFGG